MYDNEHSLGFLMAFAQNLNKPKIKIRKKRDQGPQALAQIQASAVGPLQMWARIPAISLFFIHRLPTDQDNSAPHLAQTCHLTSTRKKRVTLVSTRTRRDREESRALCRVQPTSAIHFDILGFPLRQRLPIKLDSGTFVLGGPAALAQIQQGSSTFSPMAAVLPHQTRPQGRPAALASFFNFQFLHFQAFFNFLNITIQQNGLKKEKEYPHQRLFSSNFFKKYHISAVNHQKKPRQHFLLA